MQELHEEISDLLSDKGEDRFSCPLEARKKAMDFLARREYGQKELIKKLADKGFVRNIVEKAVFQLTEDGLQSDQRFAESFAQSRINQGKGPVRIRQELKERGISATTIDDALIEKDQDWFELAREVRVRKFGQDLPADFAEKARQMKFLQYRGFESEQIQVAVNSHGDD